MNEILKPFRKKIDSLDDQIVDLLIAREQIILEVAALKKEKNIPAVLQDRVDEVRNRCEERAKDHGMSGDYVREIYRQIIQESCDLEESVLQSSKKKAS
ncbi:MAG: chorismate mutase [Pseudomonadota bacterium]